ncbi:unnamed protein product, partial [Ixodes persulcatus]
VVVLLCCLATQSSGIVETNYHSTMSTLSDLISMEKLVKTDLLRYVERLKVVQDSILNFVHDKQPYDDLTSPSAVFEYLKHPVHAFHLIKRMTAGLGVIEALINKTRKFDPLVNVIEMRKQRLLPWDEDFTGLAGSLVRLQDTYALDFQELTKGRIRTEISRNRSFPGHLPLNARDCFNISQVALRHGFYDRAVEWAEQAIAKATEEEPPTIPKQELDTFYKAAIKEHDKVLRTIGKVGYNWQTYGVPVRERVNRSTEFKAQLFDEQIEDDQVTENYKRLCRGEHLRVRVVSTTIRCHMFLGVYTLKQMKALSSSANKDRIRITYFVVCTDFSVWDFSVHGPFGAQTFRCTDISVHGQSKSRIYLSELNDAIIFLQNVPRHSFSYSVLEDVVARAAPAYHGPLKDGQRRRPRVALEFLALGEFVADGRCAMSKEGETEAHRFGNRVATLMIYMSDVEEGGATVFPGLGVRVSPKKVSMEFIYVVMRWIAFLLRKVCVPFRCAVANKWFGSYSNVFRMPCSTNQNASLAPLV